MYRIVRASVGLAALTNCIFSTGAIAEIRFAPDVALRHGSNFSELTEMLETWLDAQTDLAPRDASPEVKMINPSMVAFLTGNAGRDQEHTRGLYDPETSSIYLVLPWNPLDADDVSVYLHELAHHRQALLHYYCPGAEEEAAYRIQDSWLRERGMKANVDWLSIVLEAGCSVRDRHPD